MDLALSCTITCLIQGSYYLHDFRFLSSYEYIGSVLAVAKAFDVFPLIGGYSRGCDYISDLYPMLTSRGPRTL